MSIKTSSIIVTEIDKRWELLKGNRLCFNCLTGGHIKKYYRTKIKCFKCKAAGHHTVLCNPLQKQTQSYITDDNSKEDSSTNLVKSNALILLQTANSIATFFHQIPILCYLLAHRNAWLFPSISHSINPRQAGTKIKSCQKKKRALM